MPDSPHLSPTLAAMMCDGMGWFSGLDYKRMLLVYDRIYYLALTTLGTRSGTVVTWVFNTFGTADLVFAFYLGGRISLPDMPDLLGAGYFILAAYVPLLLIMHGLTFRVLLRTKLVAPMRSKLSTA